MPKVTIKVRKGCPEDPSPVIFRSKALLRPNAMSSSVWSIWNTTAQPLVSGLRAEEWALLIILGASAVVLWAFRERYFLVWTAGWTALVGSRLVVSHGAAMHIPGRYVPAVEQAAFVLAVGLFGAAVLLFARARNFLVPLAAITASVMGFAVARTLLWPDSLPLRVALEVSYRIVLLTASLSLLRARRGRAGSWMLAVLTGAAHAVD